MTEAAPKKKYEDGDDNVKEEQEAGSKGSKDKFYSKGRWKYKRYTCLILA